MRSAPLSGRPLPGRIATPSSKSSDEVLVGEILKAHGIAGEVVVKPLIRKHSGFESGSHLLLGTAPDTAKRFVIESSRSHQDRFLVKFEGVVDRTAAEALRGCKLFFGKQDLPDLEVDEYWEADLVGLKVTDVGGRLLGTIKGVIDRAAQDLWVVETSAGDVSVPAVKAIVRSVSIQDRLVVLDPPAGLFE